MSLDPRTPVLVGAGQVTQRIDELGGPAAGVDALELMVEAAHRAVADAGASAALLADATHVAVPQGMWSYPDPGRLLAARLGAADARTTLAELGVLQQDVLTDACARIAAGEVGVALVAGGEARYRAQQARIAGLDQPETAQPEGTTADRVWAAPSLGVDDVEILRYAVDPPTSYALIEQAIGHAAGRTPAEHRLAVGDLWARFAEVAAGVPEAWDRSGPVADAIVDPRAPGNRMIATPYTKRCCSQWNVDQAVALVLCSAAEAERHGVPRDRWVFPWAATASNHALPVVARGDLHLAPGAERAGRRVLALAGLGIDDVAVIDLYSCFPAAVEVYAAALGLALDDPRGLTVTGGMAFFGGPLNSYVLHALATMVPALRRDPGAVGLSSSVSGFLVKQGFSLWSASPPPAPTTGAGGPFAHDDVSTEVADLIDAAEGARVIDADHNGPATVASWTVVHAGGEPQRAVAVLDTPSDTRTIATTDDPAAVAAMLEGDWIGAAVATAPDDPARLVLG